MEEVQKETRRIVIMLLKISIFPVAGLIMAGNMEGLRGFVLGLGVSIITFLMLARAAWRSSGQRTVAQGQSVAIANYLVRYLFYGLTLSLAILRPDINVFACVIGLVLLKYMLIGEGMIKKIIGAVQSKLGAVEE